MSAEVRWPDSLWAAVTPQGSALPQLEGAADADVVVIGAGSGIGKETAHRLVKEGAHIVSVDLNADAAHATAKEITDKATLGHAVGLYLIGWGNRLGTIYTWMRALDVSKNRGHRVITFEQAQYRVEDSSNSVRPSHYLASVHKSGETSAAGPPGQAPAATKQA